jgi:hypothetical protein
MLALEMLSLEPCRYSLERHTLSLEPWRFTLEHEKVSLELSLERDVNTLAG